MERDVKVLSECCVWRVDILIYVTVGLSTHVFDRLFKILDDLCDEHILNMNEIVVQCGYSSYKSPNYKVFDMIPYEEQMKYIDEADYLIMHAGTGSLINCLKRGKKVIIFPRLVEYNEHVDNHQLEIADFFTKLGCVLFAKNKEELVECIYKIKEFQPKEFISNNSQMNSLIVDYIDNL